MYQVVAYHIASNINIRECRAHLNWDLLFSESDELFFKKNSGQFVYVFQHGIVSFFNTPDEEIEQLLQEIKPFSKEYVSEKQLEDVLVTIQPQVTKVEFQRVILPNLDQEMIRLVMFNASQSVALSRYSIISEQLLAETNVLTQYLEDKGKLDISGNKLKRFIAKTLNIKNRISENLYIFDSPEITWESEELNKLNQELKLCFDLKDRYRLIHDRIQIIKENLDLFRDIMDHNESKKLEWIIIILILVEVVDLFIAKLF
ncbi:MAG: RMD1 family protein [Flavobacteriaceae bacterium]